VLIAAWLIGAVGGIDRFTRDGQLARIAGACPLAMPGARRGGTYPVDAGWVVGCVALVRSRPACFDS